MKKTNLLILSVFSLFIFSANHVLYAQDTLYYDKNDKETTDKELAEYYVITKENVSLYYKMNGIFYKEETYTYQSNGRSTDTLKFVKHWEPEDKLYREEFLKNGKRHGNHIVYWENGIVKREDKYEEGKLIKGNCFDEKGEKIEYFEFEKMAEYKGGIEEFYKYLQSNIIYPENARTQNIQGIVLVEFTVEKDGSISDVQVVKSVYKSLDEEAVRVISGMPNWNPGETDQKPVRCYYQVPIQFTIMGYIPKSIKQKNKTSKK